MDLAFSDADRAFQKEVREWIAANYDEALRKQLGQSKNGYLDKAGQVAWQKKLAAKGWAAPDWPVELGGAGFSASQRYIFNMEMSLAGVPQSSPMGLKMVAPVIMAFGTDEQKAQHLPPILNSDIWWCQGYSEPGSGSDLASLQMKADRDGDDYVLNGSKIWTTHAQWADWMFCLVRTSQEAKTQNGISFLLLRMDTPGIEIKSLPTLDQPVDGQQEINQVFFTDVRVPVSQRIGEEGKGWTYAKYLLEFERGNAYAPGLMNALKKVRKIASAELGDDGEPLILDHDFRRKIAELEIKVEALNATELRIFSAMEGGEPVGPASSMLKCAGSEAQQAITELVLEAVGHYGAPYAPAFAGGNDYFPGPDYAAPAAGAYFNYRKASIYAGSNEIQRNIMAKLVLGL
ncbi:acyl-CoA dehydrogenase family protein [Caulobacter sp. NIBR1757]|uniref:acyl-CoA dehydrogenase family protein n=1 Tax=Caulobacter sp. NIBR1757 TaxID=3016000 RepID=UPI0022F104B9|nr:acyl-CoA dehydrogenase family protein [Caulobacter sp. NIBR1757]WGM38719.1 Putative acyl-CoA dehydrogenase FadE17 [Caulobacter sp. NIBR1757]